jgi:two-component system response regulator WspF
MRIAIVNDSAMAVESLRRAVTSAPEHQIAWVAYNGAEAIFNCARDRPDLILMDLIMPVMDGAEATRRIMAESPCPILVVTATVQGHSSRVFDALGAGALDAVSTPALQTDGKLGGVSSLLFKIASLGRLATPQAPPIAPAMVAAPPLDPLIAIGASAGGPAALAVVLAGLPRDLSASVVIVQHLDAQFAPGLAGWLSGQSVWPVRIAAEGDVPHAGTVLVAGADKHLVVNAGGKLAYTSEPVDCSYRPSIDVFFRSVVRHWKGKAAGVLLTGMGRDGALGLKAMRDDGAYTIAQSRDGCVVYGMPKAAAELDAATSILTLESIPQALARHFEASPVRERK